MKGVDKNITLQFDTHKGIPIPGPYLIDQLTGTERALVKVSAVSLNPADYKIHPMFVPVFRWFFPAVAARDFAGTVVGRTKDCKLALGDKVLGFTFFGTLAEYTMVACDGLVVKQPEGMNQSQAAGMVTTAATALMAWEEANMIGKKNPRVLIVGASGGTGTFGNLGFGLVWLLCLCVCCCIRVVLLVRLLCCCDIGFSMRWRRVA
jgi:NADPH:quinone reductase-like Zn-dependent oxidoreductase